MPENVKTLLEQIPAGAWGSAIMAAILSVFRIIGDKEQSKWQRIAIEAPTAGCIGMTAMMTATEFGLGPWSSGFIACMIGHLGTDYVRAVARKFVERKVSK